MNPNPADENQSDVERSAGKPEKSSQGSRPRIVTSKELFQGARELWIEHDDEMYRLRITSQGKLHMTK